MSLKKGRSGGPRPLLPNEDSPSLGTPTVLSPHGGPQPPKWVVVDGTDGTTEEVSLESTWGYEPLCVPNSGEDSSTDTAAADDSLDLDRDSPVHGLFTQDNGTNDTSTISTNAVLVSAAESLTAAAFVDDFPLGSEDMSLGVAEGEPLPTVVKSEGDAVVFEVELPLVDQPDLVGSHPLANIKLEDDSLIFSTDPMACFNPLDVEGKKKVVEQAMAIAMESPVASQRSGLAPLIMPSTSDGVTEPVKNDGITPVLQNALAGTSTEGFDLLEWVTNSSLPVHDPSFMAMIGDVSPTPGPSSSCKELPTINHQDIAEQPSINRPSAPPKGKRRIVKKASQLPRTRSSEHPNKLSSTSSTIDTFNTEETAPTPNIDGQDLKYRRMRDLNNIASKRCRQNRKRKFNELIEEEEELRLKNAELKMRCTHMEDLVGKLKKQFIEKVSNPKRPLIDLDTLLRT